MSDRQLGSWSVGSYEVQHFEVAVRVVPHRAGWAGTRRWTVSVRILIGRRGLMIRRVGW